MATIHGVNAKAIGEGLYGIFDEDEKNLVAFGMIPHNRIISCEKHLRRRFAEIACNKYGLPATSIEQIAETIKQPIMDEIIHEVCIAIYSTAKMVV